MIEERSNGVTWFSFARPHTRTEGVEFSMREEFTGLLAPLIGKSIPDMQPTFDEFAGALKKAAEAGKG